jgi:hypothetical protein
MEGEQNQRLGRYEISTISGESVRAFVPAPLPPVPAVRLDRLQLLLEQANQALGRLDGLASVLPDLSLFIYAYVRKEAVLRRKSKARSLRCLISFSSKTKKRRGYRSRMYRKSRTTSRRCTTV